ncbi:hypothetical protein AQUCO_00300472v1 [Aquilegia coerulea]|uniref:Major facilitator superfamily (MFS) profile domain-containing protein n=2 Tax=Aquilegia coerulea TaxID=218851 RepID=A0A2G5EYY8_AQUCA|nr:hypothetical protein AQUCO_00300472v1 [Aquilegia coerulea]
MFFLHLLLPVGLSVFIISICRKCFFRERNDDRIDSHNLNGNLIPVAEIPLTPLSGIEVIEEAVPGIPPIPFNENEVVEEARPEALPETNFDRIDSHNLNGNLIPVAEIPLTPLSGIEVIEEAVPGIPPIPFNENEVVEEAGPEALPETNFEYPDRLLLADVVSEIQCRRTFTLNIIWLMANIAGMELGYGLILSASIFQQNDALYKLVPKLYHEHQKSAYNYFCAPPVWKLQAVVFSWSIVAILAGVFSFPLCRKWGWRNIIKTVSTLAILGSVISTSAIHLSMLIIGRLISSIAIGLAYQIIPKYIAEIAPSEARTPVDTVFQTSVIVGIGFGYVMDHTASLIRPWGWRLFLAVECVPSLALLLISFAILEAPRSLLERGLVDLAKAILIALRGSEIARTEFLEVVEKVNDSSRSFTGLLCRKYRPHLTIALLSQISGAFTGSISASILLPPVFTFLGFGQNYLYSVVESLAVLVAASLSVFLVKHLGRRILILYSFTFVVLSLVLIGIVLHGMELDTPLDRLSSITIVFLFCCLIIASNAATNPTGWMSEAFPLKLTWAGSILSTSSNWIFTFGVGQAVIVGICKLHELFFFLCAGVCIVFFIFIYLLLPETTGLNVDEVLSNHWIWRRFVRV